MIKQMTNLFESNNCQLQQGPHDDDADRDSGCPADVASALKQPLWVSCFSVSVVVVGVDADVVEQVVCFDILTCS